MHSIAIFISLQINLLKKNMNHLSTLSFFFILITMACAKKTISTTENQTQVQAQIETISNQWKLVSAFGKAIQQQTLFLTFNEEDLTFYGNAQCNSIFGKIVLADENEIKLTNTGRTLMACEQLDQEEVYIQWLNQIASYALEGNKLVFYNEKSELILIYEYSNALPSENKDKGVLSVHEKSPVMRLYDIWGLKMMNGKPANVGCTLELNTKEMRFLGNAMCNSFLGKLTSQAEDELIFDISFCYIRKTQR